MTGRRDRAGDRITSKAALLDALLLERYGSLHPEYRPTEADREAAADRRDLDDIGQPVALRLITANPGPTPKNTSGLDETAIDPTGTEQ
jgi:hypothetical protein